MSVARGQSSIRAFHFWSAPSPALPTPPPSLEPGCAGGLRRSSEEERMRLIGSSSLWANQRFVRSAGCHIHADMHTHTWIYRAVDTEGGKSERQGGEGEEQRGKKAQLAGIQTPDTALCPPAVCLLPAEPLRILIVDQPLNDQQTVSSAPAVCLTAAATAFRL